MLTVASPLTAHYFLSTSHGSTPGHLVPVAEAPGLPGKIFWTSIGEESVFALLPHFLGGTETAPKLLTEKTRAIWKVLHKLQSNQPVLLRSLTGKTRTENT